MSYQVIAHDECGTETVVQSGFNSSDEAYDSLPQLRDSYPEFSRWNVEEKYNPYSSYDPDDPFGDFAGDEGYY